MDKSIDILEEDFSKLCHVRSIKKRRCSVNSSKIYLQKQTIKEPIIKNEDSLERPDFFEPLTNPRKRHRSNAIVE
jgi:hypothetical protein